MKIKTLGVHWFRRDLRLAGNPSLKINVERNNGHVLGIFCFDSVFLKREDFSHNRFAFFLKTLRALQLEMKNAGGELLVIDQLPFEAFAELSSRLKDTYKLQTFSWNRDYEPFARERDQKIKNLLVNDLKLEVITERDHLLIEPHELTKSSTPSEKNFYQVFSPFAKKWYTQIKTKEFSERATDQKKGLDYLKALALGKTPKDIFKVQWHEVLKTPLIDQIENFEEQNSKHVTIQIPKAGSLAAFETLVNFSEKISNYSKARDFPDLNGTSHFSIFFKNGSLTTAQVVAFLKLERMEYESESGENKFLKELVWREFYYSVLYHVPRVEHEAFLEKYKNIEWQNNKKLFEAWCQGRTGYPIIDAGMRQLNTTGWMHNRVRMIVASFLTKDLLIDYRWGENYFMKTLMDGDLAPNNGGWQWAASTGCDPQPYFRIFNPLLQSQKFDPNGDYIRKYVPELKHLGAKEIHEPTGVKNYPAPIVIHKDQKAKALALYK